MPRPDLTQSLQVAHSTVLRQSQWRELSRRLGKVFRAGIDLTRSAGIASSRSTGGSTSTRPSRVPLLRIPFTNLIPEGARTVGDPLQNLTVSQPRAHHAATVQVRHRDTLGMSYP